MIVSSSLVYAWQEVQIRSNSAVVTRDQQIGVLQDQVNTLSAASKNYQANLQVQQQKLTDTASKLSDVQKQLDAKTTALAAEDAQLAAAQKQVKQQEQQLTDNASQLAELRSHPPLFSFQNKSSLTDVTVKEAEIKQYVADIYTYLTQLYGQPYLLKNVTITFVNQFSIAGSSGEIVISNSTDGMSMDIHIKDYDPNSFEDRNTIPHEIIHAFHGITVLPSALEEGMTVAATDALMGNMIADNKIPSFNPLYINITAAQYASYNQSLSVSKDSDTFYSDPKISYVYQMIGYAWYQLYREDPTFFKKFNDAYYAQYQHGKTPDAAAIRDIIRTIIPSVAGQPIDTYLAQNRAFNPS